MGQIEDKMWKVMRESEEVFSKTFYEMLEVFTCQLSAAGKKAKDIMDASEFAFFDLVRSHSLKPFRSLAEMSWATCDLCHKPHWSEYFGKSFCYSDYSEPSNEKYGEMDIKSEYAEYEAVFFQIEDARLSREYKRGKDARKSKYRLKV